jgi:hypothetical protein
MTRDLRDFQAEPPATCPSTTTRSAPRVSTRTTRVETGWWAELADDEAVAGGRVIRCIRRRGSGGGRGAGVVVAAAGRDEGDTDEDGYHESIPGVHGALLGSSTARWARRATATARRSRVLVSVALRLCSTDEGRWLSNLALRATPVLIELGAITAIYRVVPHRSVDWRHAFAGALLATLLLEIAKWGMGLFLASFDGYQRLYGALAALPILLLWIYLCWIAVLLGASLASAVSAFRYQPVAMRLPQGYEMYGLLRLLGRFSQARTRGEGLHIAQMMDLEPLLTDSLLHELLTQLGDIGLIKRAENGEWLLARDLDDLTMAELYEACRLRIPIAEAHLPCRDDELGVAAVAALDDLRVPLRDLLKRNVADLFPQGPHR